MICGGRQLVLDDMRGVVEGVKRIVGKCGFDVPLALLD